MHTNVARVATKSLEHVGGDKRSLRSGLKSRLAGLAAADAVDAVKERWIAMRHPRWLGTDEVLNDSSVSGRFEELRSWLAGVPLDPLARRVLEPHECLIRGGLY